MYIWVRKFSVVSGRNATQASSNRKWSFTHLWRRVRVWWGETGFQWLLCQAAIGTHQQGESWLSCGGGVEKFCTIRKLVSKPGARKGKVTGPNSHSYSRVQQWFEPRLSVLWPLYNSLCLLPSECITLEPTRFLKQWCQYLNLTF